MGGGLQEEAGPTILVFATNNISDPGIDLAGSAHLAYPTSVRVIPVPCSSGVDPRWVLHALQSGIAGVFIAADGSDCAYLPNCTERTGEVVERAHLLLKEQALDPRRLKMAAICSVCAESFVSSIESFRLALSEL